jgi:hypothetical protein
MNILTQLAGVRFVKAAVFIKQSFWSSWYCYNISQSCQFQKCGVDIIKKVWVVGWLVTIAL